MPQGYSGRPIAYIRGLVSLIALGLILKSLFTMTLMTVLSDEEFSALDFDGIKKNTGLNLVMHNGYRYWVLDKIEGKKIVPRRALANHEFLVPSICDRSRIKRKAILKSYNTQDS